jgi:hypothetical protein
LALFFALDLALCRRVLPGRALQCTSNCLLIKRNDFDISHHRQNASVFVRVTGLTLYPGDR